MATSVLTAVSTDVASRSAIGGSVELQEHENEDEICEFGLLNDRDRCPETRFFIEVSN